MGRYVFRNYCGSENNDQIDDVGDRREEAQGKLDGQHHARASVLGFRCPNFGGMVPVVPVIRG